MPDIRILASDLGFPEGPVWMADGSVILGEISGRKVTRVAPDGSKTEIGKAGGGPNGVATGPDGALYVCNNGGAVYQTTPSFLSTGPAPDYKSGSIQRIDPKTGETRTLYNQCNGHKLSAPNDIVFDKQGGFYFTDLGKRYAHHRDNGGLYYALPDGSKVVELVYPMLTPNGVGLSPDERTVYVADTENHVIRRIDLRTGLITTVLGTGSRGDGPEPSPLECRLARPHGVLAANDVLYVSDSEAHRIRVVR